MSPFEPKRNVSEYSFPRANGDQGYPGLDLTKERMEQIRNLTLDPDEITADDIVWNVSRNASSYFFSLLKNAVEMCGEEVARELARRLGYTAGCSNYRKMQRRFGATNLTAEQVAQYEDTVHLLGGVEMATCTSEYDANTWTGRRTRCPFYTGAPEGAGHYCRYVQEGFERAYKECDPNIQEMRYEKSLIKGDGECIHVIRFGPGKK